MYHVWMPRARLDLVMLCWLLCIDVVIYNIIYNLYIFRSGNSMKYYPQGKIRSRSINDIILTLAGIAVYFAG